MRLGQGFNSYTQQICIDDAVVIDPNHPENVLNNSGLTMKMLAQQTGTVSALERVPGLASAGTSAGGDWASGGNSSASGAVEPAEKVVNQSTSFSIQPKKSDPTPTGTKSTVGSAPPDPKKREDERKAARDGAAKEFAQAMTLEEMQKKMDEMTERFEKRMQENVQDVREAPGTALPWTATEALGPGQVVSYVSKFVNKISEVSDEMKISGSLSIKYNAIGGSGSGSFFDAEKFYQSDLKYIVSVKVINQTVNFKDALVFNPLRTCMNDQKKFNDTFGDSFISGFLEGGEFNALVLKTIHNKEKQRDITAQAKVALTAGPVEVSAQGNVKLAETNIKNNSETSVYVRWCGGGNIKPYSQDWTTESVVAAAARFPALCGLFPQRTYAILTPYANLRSYLLLKPIQLSPLRYELAQMYTNILLDAFMEYKSLAKRLSTDVADIQAGLKEFAKVDNLARPGLSTSIKNAGLNFYPSTLVGLDDARKAIRAQQNIIVAEVDLMAQRPEIGSDPQRRQPFVGPGSFSILLPEVILRSSRRRINAAPLDVERINKVQDPSKAEEDKTVDEEAPPLFSTVGTSLRLSGAEQTKLTELENQSFGIGAVYQVSAPVGDPDRGKPFCTLDFAQSEESISEITVIVDQQKKLRSIVLGYDNGVFCTFGAPVTQAELEAAPAEHKLANIAPVGQKIVSGKIQVLTYRDAQQELKQRVVGLSLALTPEKKIELVCPTPSSSEQVLKTESFGVPASTLKLSGLWGQGIETGPEAGITRLGFIWGPAVSSASVAGDEPGRPKTVTSVARSIYPKTREGNVLNTVKFPYILLDPPLLRFILAPHFLKSGAKSKESMDSEKMERLRLLSAADQSKFTVKQFELEARTRFDEDAIYVNYMVMPEFKSAQIELGEIDFGNLNGQSSLRLPIKLAKPFGADVSVNRVCWITAINARPKDAGGMLHVRTTIVDRPAPEKGSDVVVEALEGTQIESIKIGWLIHTEPEKTNADFVSGTATVRDVVDSVKSESKLSRTLQEKPVSQFVGINELKTSMSNLVGFGAIFLPETSKDTVLLNVCSFGKNKIETLGMSWILSM
ncbi:hypothetical protein OC846_006337 [Tilletia horrida]|uniref:Uncharacterized protein n=1 Tax=Tilletia horrida TaxID=155126 RepID=A0AAN6GLI1_9BASI|nr:hypothetical protein OC846_006337 [Tilletia horrida]KAK0544181.1 hypothetical protein OC845_005739 [Tilletia horrida]